MADLNIMPPGTMLLSSLTSNKVVLQPTPTDDPNDPLNWSKWRKCLNFGLVLFYVLWTFVALNISSVAYPEYVQDLGMTFNIFNIIAAVNYAGLAVGCYFFIPFAYKFGRRPVYLLSLFLQFGSVLWVTQLNDTANFIAGSVFAGLGGAISETLVQMTIADLFFVHQYGTMNSFNLLAQSVGAYLAPTAAGYVVESQGWRWIWWWCVIFIGVIIVLVLFFFEETAYTPAIAGVANDETRQPHQDDGVKAAEESGGKAVRMSSVATGAIARKPLRKRLAFYTKTSDPVGHHFYQPLVMLLRCPAVTYAATTYAMLLACFAVIANIVASMMVYPPYNFAPSDIGLFNIPPFVGALLGSAAIALVSDWSIVRLARRNSGIYEAEMRLYPAIPGALLCMGGLLMFGLGLSHGQPWPLLAVGYGIFGFGFTVCADVALSYLTDCYRAILGDALVGVIFLRNAVSVAILFALAPWVASMKLEYVFVILACISLVILLVPVPLLVWGKKLRRSTIKLHNRWAEKQDGRVKYGPTELGQGQYQRETDI